MNAKKKSTSKAPPKKRVRDRGLAESKLIEAGIELFSKLGVDGATTRAISQRAGINESLIVRYFGGKEGLLFRIIQKFFEREEARALTYPEQDSVYDELRLFFQGEVDELFKQRDFFRIVISKGLVDEQFAKKVRAISPLVADPRLLKRVVSLQKRNLIGQEHDAQALAMHIGIQTFGLVFVSHMLFGLGKDYANNLLDLFAKTFSMGIVPKGKNI